MTSYPRVVRDVCVCVCLHPYTRTSQRVVEQWSWFVGSGIGISQLDFSLQLPKMGKDEASYTH